MHPDRPTDRQMDRQTAQILQSPFSKDEGLIMLFRNSRIKFPEIIWLDCEPYEKESIPEKGTPLT